MLATLLLFDPIRAMVGFVILAVCFAIIIILAKWLISLTGISIPQPLLLVLGLIVFLVLFLFFLNYVGAFTDFRF